MRSRLLSLLAAITLILGLAGLSCARVVLPVGPPVGPVPTPAMQPPTASHGLIAQQDCLACHSADESFVAILCSGHPIPQPPGFSGSTQEACQLCHSMEEGHPLAPAISHPVEDGENCLACHAGGIGSIPPMPASHSGYAAGTCSGCHAPGTVTPGPSPAPPAISHGVGGMESCLSCHGVASAVAPLPEYHAGFAEQSCGLCHAQPSPPSTPEQPLAAPSIAHVTDGMESCLSCHGVASAVAPLTEDHGSRTNATCTGCHAPGTVTPGPSQAPPAISHGMSGMESCLSCHGVVSGIAPLPEDHAGFAEQSCGLCHAPPAPPSTSE